MSKFARTILIPLALVTSAAALSACEALGMGGGGDTASMQPSPDVSAQVTDAELAAEQAADAAERAELAADRAAAAAERAERAFQLSQQK